MNAESLFFLSGAAEMVTCLLFFLRITNRYSFPVGNGDLYSILSAFRGGFPKAKVTRYFFKKGGKTIFKI